MTYWVPGVTKRPISVNYTAARRPRTLGTILHVTAAPGAVSQFGWFNNPSARASSHFHVDIYGKSEQYVDADQIAWCQRAGNSEYLSIETQGGANGEWTTRQAAEILRILSLLSKRYGFPLVDTLNSLPGRRGVGLHRYGCDPFRVSGGAVWGPPGKVCPGPDRLRQFKSGFLDGEAGGIYTTTYVKQIQNLLIKTGYSVGSSGADGLLGPATTAAVKKFQRDWGLTVDGDPGPKTLARLKEVAEMDPKEFAAEVWKYVFQGFTFDGTTVEDETAGVRIKQLRQSMIRATRRDEETLVGVRTLVQGQAALTDALVGVITALNDLSNRVDGLDVDAVQQQLQDLVAQVFSNVELTLRALPQPDPEV